MMGMKSSRKMFEAMPRPFADSAAVSRLMATFWCPSSMPVAPGALRNRLKVASLCKGKLSISSALKVYCRRVSSGLRPWLSSAVTDTVSVALPSLRWISTPTVASVERVIGCSVRSNPGAVAETVYDPGASRLK